MCLLAKIFFTAQILLPTRIQVQQLTATCRWYIWQASIFRVPITTIQRPKYEGGWNIPNIDLKCKTLLYNRIQILGATDGSVMAQLFHTCVIRTVLPTTPSPKRTGCRRSLNTCSNTPSIWPMYHHQHTPKVATLPNDTFMRPSDKWAWTRTQTARCG